MTPSEETEMRDVLRGKLDSLPVIPASVFRVYLASSSTDMCIERAVLAKNVYPELREYCRSHYNTDLQVLDLRLGAEFSEDPTAVPLRLQEIKKCQQLSLGTSFVLLIGQKYGSSILPTNIVAREFEQIRTYLSTGQAALLDTWYTRDDNACPPEVVLRPTVTGSWGKAASEWRETAGELRRALQEGVRRSVQVGKLEMDIEPKYFLSELETEVEKGILEDQNANSRCLLFHRKLENVNLSHELASHFVDLDASGNLDTHKQSLCNHIASQKVPSKIHSNNIHPFTVQWTDEGGINEEEHADYLQDFCKAFKEAMLEQIDAKMTKRADSGFQKDEVVREILEHVHECSKRSTRIHGRDDILQRIRHYVTENFNQPLVLYGKPGIGKSCIMSKAASLVSLWLEDYPSPTVVITRFLGTTPSSSSLDGLLRSICQHMHRIFDTSVVLPDDHEELREHFLQLLEEAPPHLTIIIFLDGLENLINDDQQSANNPIWMPNRLPDNIKIIASCIDSDKGKKILKDLRKKKISKEQFEEIHPLDPDTSKMMMKSWMTNARRTLTPQQWRAVNEALHQGCSPLYLKLLLEHITTWKSDNIEIDLPSTSEAFFSLVIDALEAKHGKNMVSTILGMIMFTNYGLTEIEAEDMLSLDDTVLTNIFKDYVPPVRRMPSILWYKLLHDIRNFISYTSVDSKSVIKFTYMVCEKELKQRYLATWVTAVGSRVKNLFIDYFTGRWHELEKPFKYFPNQQKMLGLKEPDSSAFRSVPSQPTLIKYTENDQVQWHVNYRKVRVLSSVLYNDAIYWDNEEALFRFMRLVPFNFEMLTALLLMDEWQLLMRILQIRQVIDDEDGEFEKRQVALYIRCLVSLRKYLVENPSSIMIHLVGQLLGHYNFLTHPTALIRQADKAAARQFCALTCPYQQIPLAGEIIYLEASRHSTPITNCCFIGNCLFTVSDKLVGVSFDNYGHQSSIIVNTKIQGIPKGDYFNLMEVVGANMPNDIIEEGDNQKLLASGKIALALRYQPKVFIINVMSGQILHAIDCGRDLSNEDKQQKITHLKVIAPTVQDSQIHVTLSNGAMVLVYSCQTGKFLYSMSSKDNKVLDIVQMEDGCFCALLQNGEVTVLDNIQGKQARTNSHLQQQSQPLSTLKYGYNLTSWNRGKWGSIGSDVLILGVDNGQLMGFFGVNPCQAETASPISASVKLPDQTPIHYIDTDVKGLRTRVALALVCTDNWVHLVKFEVGRNKQCSTTLAASMKKQLEEALLFDDVLVGRHLNAILVASCGNQGDGSYSIKKLAVLDIHTTPIVLMKPSAMVSATQTNRMVAAVSEDGSCKAFNLATVQMSSDHITTYERMEGAISTITAGVSLAATTENDNSQVAVFDVQTGSLMKLFSHSDCVKQCCFSTNERYLATIDIKGSFRVWDILVAASTVEISTPILSYKLKGAKYWLFWCQDSHFLIVCDCGTHVRVHPKMKEIKETINPLVPQPLLDVIMNNRDEVLALGAEGRILTSSKPGETTEMYRMDLKSKTGLSISKYGNTIWKLGVSGQNTLLLIGDTLLCCKLTSNSIFPMHKGMSADAHLLAAGTTMAFINRGKLSVLTDLDGGWNVFDFNIKNNMVCLTADGKYAVIVEEPKTLKLIRVEDRQELASFSFLVDISSLQVSSDGVFVIVGGVDGRVYSYVIADPDDSSHDERIKNLPSRQQPVILQIERPHDPRYKVLRNMTVDMETSSFAGSEGESDEGGEDSSDEDESDVGSAEGNLSDFGSSGDDDDNDDLDSSSESEQSIKQKTTRPKSSQKNVRRESAKQERSKPKPIANGKKQNSVFMPLPNGTVCLAPVSYRQPVLQGGYKNRIQKLNNRFTEVDISSRPYTQADKSGQVTRSAEVRNIWTAPVSRDARRANVRLTSLHSRKGTSSMASPRPSSGEGLSGSKACVIS